MKKDLIKKIEGILYNYKTSLVEINNLKIDLEMMKEEYRGITSINYGEKSSPTNKFNSSVENEVIKREEMIVQLENNIRYKDAMYRKVTNSFDILDEREYRFIKEFYFEKCSYMRVSEIMNMSYSYVYDYKMAVLNKISPLIFTSNLP
ncbi:hypothetical protein SAMN02745163_01561 [Clostridium cavendishii DSM 21758]|uniref:Phage transcriptional regulator, RinA family n=1 Tax=Clostridium cavendishii DSM 21758 TaxID=1121302 RepID=A0A1M6HS23_9CLOT|nr:hypothetical protein [Clostridium cavendishii]SHJ25011.1 hypothetical protein SAMN02745163_01561 [Clostridium cavendishii DSM 21758]